MIVTGVGMGMGKGVFQEVWRIPEAAARAGGGLGLDGP